LREEVELPCVALLAEEPVPELLPADADPLGLLPVPLDDGV